MIPSALLDVHATLLPDGEAFCALLATGVSQQRALALYPLDFTVAIQHLTANLNRPQPLLAAVSAAGRGREVLNEFYDRLFIRNEKLTAQWEAGVSKVYSSEVCATFASAADQLLSQSAEPRLVINYSNLGLLEIAERIYDFYWLAANWELLLTEREAAALTGTRSGDDERFCTIFERLVLHVGASSLLSALRNVQGAPPRYNR